MKDDELREMAAQAIAAAVRCEVAAASIAESAHQLMNLINTTQADAAKMIAGQMKRSEYVAKKLEALKGQPPPPGSKVRLSDGRVVDVPALRGSDAQGDASER